MPASRQSHVPISDTHDRFVLTSPRTYSTADSTLINGLGRSTDDSGADAELAVITVTQGKRYRFRLVSMSCDPNHTFSIDGHNMTIIEADSQNVHPVVADSLQIFVAQRYSFIVSVAVARTTAAI